MVFHGAQDGQTSPATGFSGGQARARPVRGNFPDSAAEQQPTDPWSFNGILKRFPSGKGESSLSTSNRGRALRRPSSQADAGS